MADPSPPVGPHPAKNQAVRALVLIYDIRGFTSAAKRLASANLGAFASGAHKAIIDLFAAIPPTFVKNLGDGHLLLWEVEEERDDGAPGLIEKVVAAARQAQTTFAAFATAHGEAGGALPRHVGVGVAVGEVSKSDDYYGTALNLAARLQNLSRPEGVAVDATVFEAAAARDASIREQFRHARVKLKGLGTTNVWVKRPFSWARALAPVGKFLAIAALPAAYVALSDAGLTVPGGPAVRRRLDALGLSVFRPVRSRAEVARVSGDSCRALAAMLLRSQTPEGWFGPEIGAVAETKFDEWSSAQDIYALLRCPSLSVERKRTLLPGLAYALDPARRIEVDGVAYGWPAHAGFSYTEAEPLLWTAIALARALGIEGLVPSADRPLWLERFRWVERATKMYRPDESGGWNIFPNQTEPDHHSPYSTALALLALIETREAGLPFDGSVERRDALLAAAANYLVTTYLPDAATPGWRRTEDPHDVVSPGLTLQIYGLLLRASGVTAWVVPASILREIPRRLEALVGERIDVAADAGEFVVEFTSHKGVKETRNEAINFLWHPWAIEAARLWLGAVDSDLDVPEADRVAVRRVLGHLVVDMGDEAVKAASNGYNFIAAETLMGLSEAAR